MELERTFIASPTNAFNFDMFFSLFLSIRFTQLFCSFLNVNNRIEPRLVKQQPECHWISIIYNIHTLIFPDIDRHISVRDNKSINK